jgi:hypothetical protein
MFTFLTAAIAPCAHSELGLIQKVMCSDKKFIFCLLKNQLNNYLVIDPEGLSA